MSNMQLNLYVIKTNYIILSSRDLAESAIIDECISKSVNCQSEFPI